MLLVRLSSVIACATALAASACSDDTALVPSDAGADVDVKDVVAPPIRPPRVLLYTKQTEWFHDANPVAARVMSERGQARGWSVTTSAESAVFSAEGLRAFDVVVFLLSSGATLAQAQRDAFASWIALGHGWVGAHSASHTDYDWSFMTELVGASFCCHPPIMAADVLVQDAKDPIVAHLPAVWRRVDEWYTFDRRPEQNPRLHILIALDELSARPDYPGPDQPPALRVGFHPTTWRQDFGATRSFYTGMGHTLESWQDEAFVSMMVKAVEWAGRYAP